MGNENIERVNYCFDNPYSYLKSEYIRLNNKKNNVQDIDYDSCFELFKDIYGDEQVNLFEKDKVLFKKLKEIQLNIKVPIEEQDRRTFCMLEKHSNNIIDICKKNNIYLKKNIVLGTVPLAELNAFMCMFPKNEVLIALNQGLFQFLYLMGRVISSSFSMKKNSKGQQIFNWNIDDIDEILKKNNKCNFRFLEALIFYFVYENFDLSQVYFEEDEKLYLSATLWDNAEFFIVAHEYAHIILEDLEKKQDEKKEFLDDESMLYKVYGNWDNEMKADGIALQMTMAYNLNQWYGILGNYLGVEFLFACLELIEKISKIDSNETHPSAKIRINNIRKYLLKILPESADNLIAAGKVIEVVIDKLWERNKEVFYKNCEVIRKN